MAYTILDAITDARSRNQQRDQVNQQREAKWPYLPGNGSSGTAGQPAPMMADTGGNEQPETKDLRTPHDKYLDAIDVNNSGLVAMPIIGAPIGLMNDMYISSYEKANPDKVVGGPKYSLLGRIGGIGQPQPTPGQPGPTLWQRITNTAPMNVRREGDYIGSFPQDSGGDGGGFYDDATMGPASAVSYDDYSGYA